MSNIKIHWILESQYFFLLPSQTSHLNQSRTLNWATYLSLFEKYYQKLPRKEGIRHLPPSESAYRTGGSTGNFVLTPCFIATKYQIYQQHKIFLTGIDLSSAFDTITHQSLSNKIASFLSEDESQMTHLFFRESINFNKHWPDVVSMLHLLKVMPLFGVFFNIELERALRFVRQSKLVQTIHKSTLMLNILVWTQQYKYIYKLIHSAVQHRKCDNLWNNPYKHK